MAEIKGESASAIGLVDHGVFCSYASYFVMNIIFIRWFALLDDCIDIKINIECTWAFLSAALNGAWKMVE